MKTLLKFLLLICLLDTYSLAGTIDPNVPDEKYIEYGKKHKCVVEICGIDKNSEKKFSASAVIIKPKIILTAAHILSEAANNKSFIILDTNKINIVASIYPAGYSQETFAIKDIAIGFLEKEVNLDFYPELYDKDDETGKICSISGMGITGNHNTGATIHDGQKRAGSNIIDETFKELLICSLNTGKKTSLEFLIANGDSGGGLFIDKKLAGINSCVMADDGSLNSNYRDWSGHTRVSIHKPWIDEIVTLLENLKPE
ncbi:hypothetical protein EBZ38_07885 [bacterium]|nr:hypothetical protein [bacterium]